MNENKSQLRRLFQKYKWRILSISSFAILCIVYSLYIYTLDPLSTFYEKLADFLMTVGETILVVGFIGGSIAGSINFILEEVKAEHQRQAEEAKKEQEERNKKAEKIKRQRAKNQLFRQEMHHKLQSVHDNIELARILIKSHKSGKTYGEQIRNRIMPAMISLLEFKRSLRNGTEHDLTEKMEYLQVSLRYMIAYLMVLVEEFECQYLEISNLQNYQEALAIRMRMLFTEMMETEFEQQTSLKKKKQFLQKAEDLFEDTTVPSYIAAVWKALENLDYIRDFMDELVDNKGKKSIYHKYFLQHYNHCKKILKTGKERKSLVNAPVFQANIREFKRISEKRNSPELLTNEDSLTKKIMVMELKFDFESGQMKP